MASEVTFKKQPAWRERLEGYSVIAFMLLCIVLVPVVFLLRDIKMDKIAKTEHEGSEIQNMIKEGNMAGIRDKILLSDNIDEKNAFGNTALHTATRYCNKKALSILIDVKADVNAANKYGATPLHYAAMYCDQFAIKALLEAGAEIDAMDNRRYTAFRYTAEKNENNLNCKYLKYKGADIIGTSGECYHQKGLL